MKISLAVCLCVCLLMAACTPAPAAVPTAQPVAAANPASPSSAPAPLSPTVKIRISTIGLSGEAGTFIALDRGYLAQEGLDLELVPGLSTPDVIAGLLAGNLDVGAIALDVSLFNAVQHNVGLKIFAPQTFIPPDDKNASIIVRKDLIDSGEYKTAQDLKGKNIAIGAVPNTSAQLFVEDALAKGNLTAKDATFVTLGFPDMLPALASKKIDAAWEVEPLATAAESSGLAAEVMWSGDLFPNYDPLLLVESPRFAQTQPEALKRFEVAHLRGQRDYFNAFQKNIGGADARSAIFDILAGHTTVKDVKTWQSLTDKGRMQSVDPNDAFHLDGFDVLQKYFLRIGTLQNTVDAQSILDPAPAAYALERLGKLSQEF